MFYKFLLLVASFLGIANSESCPSNFLQLQDKCYYFSAQRMQWKEAYFKCKEMDSILVSLRSKLNSYRLNRYLLRSHLDSSEWWIGALFDWQQKRWVWAGSGTPLKYDHFIYPRIMKKKLDWHCAYLDPREKFRWNADLCVQPKRFICLKSIQTAEPKETDNTIPLIVSRGLLEEEHLKLNESYLAEPAFIKKGSRRTKTRTKLVKFVCPKGYRHVRGNCYRFSKDQKSWQDAYYTCDAEFNGTLAMIPHRKHDEALRRLANRIGVRVHERWLGGIYDWERAAWKWATNGAIIQHQAADRDKLKWNCLVWSPLITDKWTSDSCHVKKYYICQSNGSRVEAEVPQVKRRRPELKAVKAENVTDAA